MMIMAYAIALSLIIHQQGKPATPDPSTPEAAVKSLITLISSGKYAAATQYISGATASPGLQKMERDQQRLNNARFPLVVESATSEISGSIALVKVKVVFKGPAVNSVEDTLKLTQGDGNWKVVPLTLDEFLETFAAIRASKPPKHGFIAFTISMLMYPEVFEKPREAAKETACRTNLKQLQLGVLMYLSDIDFVFKFNTAKYKSKIAVYVQNDKIFSCPSDSVVKDSYSLNHALEGKSLAAITKPQQTVLLYEGKNSVLDFRHNGKANVGFVDGHVKAVTAAEAKSLRWKP